MGLRMSLMGRHHIIIAFGIPRCGQKNSAREYYKKFLELWKGADPGFEEVKDAGKRLAATF